MSLSPSSDPNETDSFQSVTNAISREMAQLYLSAFGRGPARPRTFLPPQFAVCVLRDVLTPTERTLVDSGEVEVVEAGRQKINDTLDAEFIEIIEANTGKLVQSHLVHAKVSDDVVVHLFLFHDPVSSV
jgi:uncharacterized protein YbcI